MRYRYECQECGAWIDLRPFDQDNPAEKRFRFCSSCGKYTQQELRNER